MYFKTMAEIKEANKQAGNKFFINSSFHKSKIHTSSPLKGRFFVTSEQMGSKASDRRFFLRFAEKNGSIKKICPLMGFYTKAGAMNFYKSFPDDIVKGLDFALNCGYNNIRKFEETRKDESNDLYSVCNFIYENSEDFNLGNINLLKEKGLY